MPEPPPATLRDLVDMAQRRHGTTSTPRLAEIARARGFKMVHTTLSRIRKGTYGYTTSKDTIRALAFLAGVRYSVAAKAAGLGTLSAPFADQLPRDVDLLTPKQRTAVLGIVRALIDAEQAVRAAQAQPIGDDVAFVTEEDLEGADGGNEMGQPG